MASCATNSGLLHCSEPVISIYFQPQTAVLLYPLPLIYFVKKKKKSPALLIFCVFVPMFNHLIYSFGLLMLYQIYEWEQASVKCSGGH